MNAGATGTGRADSSGFVPFGGAGDTRQWVRVASTVLDRIDRGVYTNRLPGRAALVAEFSVAARTVQRAITELAARDVVYRVPGLGYRIRRTGQQAGAGLASGGPAGQATGDPRAWMRVTAALLDRIGRGELKPWELIPPRKVLCREFGCSRSPVTHALTDLEHRGVIRRIPGVGYQVQPVPAEVPDAGVAVAATVTAGDLMPGRTP